jgi:ABC-2 type transport system permease protein
VLEYLWRETLYIALLAACCSLRAFDLSGSDWSSRAADSVSGAGRSPPHRTRPHPARADAARPDGAAHVLSNAATFEIRNTPIQIVDFDRTPASRGSSTTSPPTATSRSSTRTPSLDRVEERLLDGSITMAVVIPRDFEKSLVKTGMAPVQLSVNGEKGSAAGIVQAYATRVLTQYAAGLTRPGEPGRPGAAPPRIDVRTRSRYNPTLNYQYYMVPGILVALMTIIGSLLSAQNIAREKGARHARAAERHADYAWAVHHRETAAVLGAWAHRAVARSADRHAGLRHSCSAEACRCCTAVAGVYLAVAVGIGLWISALVDTQQQAMFVTFFIVNIYLLMSGLFTPIDSMAPWVQTVTLINPVRHFVAISRAILMKGAGPAEIAQPFLILIGTATVVLIIAVGQYRKRAA